jgi:hypothetical protein
VAESVAREQAKAEAASRVREEMKKETARRETQRRQLGDARFLRSEGFRLECEGPTQYGGFENSKEHGGAVHAIRQIQSPRRVVEMAPEGGFNQFGSRSTKLKEYTESNAGLPLNMRTGRALELWNFRRMLENAGGIWWWKFQREKTISFHQRSKSTKWIDSSRLFLSLVAMDPIRCLNLGVFFHEIRQILQYTRYIFNRCVIIFIMICYLHFLLIFKEMSNFHALRRSIHSILSCRSSVKVAN